MRKISTASELRLEIEQLQIAGFRKKEALKDEFAGVMEGLKPVNLIKHTIHSAFSGDKRDLLKGAVSLGSGILSKRLFVGGSGGILKRIVGTALQFGVSGIIAKNAEVIKEKGSAFLGKLFQKNNHTPKTADPQKLKQII